MYGHCIKRLAHVQSYCYMVVLPWIVESFCDLVEDVVQNSVLSVYVQIHIDEKKLEGFLLFVVIAFSLVFWKEMKVIRNGSLCQCCGLCLF